MENSSLNIPKIHPPKFIRHNVFKGLQVYSTRFNKEIDFSFSDERNTDLNSEMLAYTLIPNNEKVLTSSIIIFEKKLAVSDFIDILILYFLSANESESLLDIFPVGEDLSLEYRFVCDGANYLYYLRVKNRLLIDEMLSYDDIYSGTTNIYSTSFANNDELNIKKEEILKKFRESFNIFTTLQTISQFENRIVIHEIKTLVNKFSRQADGSKELFGYLVLYFMPIFEEYEITGNHTVVFKRKGASHYEDISFFSQEELIVTTLVLHIINCQIMDVNLYIYNLQLFTTGIYRKWNIVQKIAHLVNHLQFNAQDYQVLGTFNIELLNDAILMDRDHSLSLIKDYFKD